MIEKPCNKCGNKKPLDEFYKHKQSKDGHQSYCKQCQLKRANESNKKKRGDRPLRAGKGARYTEVEDESVKKYYPAMSASRIVRYKLILNRSVNSIRGRARTLGVKKN